MTDDEHADEKAIVRELCDAMDHLNAAQRLTVVTEHGDKYNKHLNDALQNLATVNLHVANNVLTNEEWRELCKELID